MNYANLGLFFSLGVALSMGGLQMNNIWFWVIVFSTILIGVNSYHWGRRDGFFLNT